MNSQLTSVQTKMIVSFDEELAANKQRIINATISDSNMHAQFTYLLRFSFPPSAVRLLLICCCTLLVGCGSLPPPTASVPQAVPPTNYRASMALLKVPALCAHRDNPPYDISEGSLDVPNCMFANIETHIGPQFSAFSTASPTDKWDSDLFLMPQKQDVRIDWGVTTLGKNNLIFEAGFQLLDKNGIPLSKIRTTGHSAFRLGSSFTQRANYMKGFYAGVGDSVSALSTNALFCFFATNSDFLNENDMAKALEIAQLLATTPNPPKYAQQLVAYAAAGNYPRLLGELLKRGGDVNTVRQDNGMSLLHLAALYNSPDAIKALLSAGANTEHRDRDQRLAIDYAIWNGRTEAIEAFLAANAATDFSEMLPLSSSAIWESFGDYYVSRWNKTQAERSYRNAKRAADSRSSFSYPSGINGMVFKMTQDLGADSAGRRGFASVSVSVPTSSPYLGALGLNGTTSDYIRYFISYGSEMSGFLAAFRARSSTAGMFALPPSGIGLKQSDFELELAVLTATQAKRSGVLDEIKMRRLEREARVARKQSALEEATSAEQFNELVMKSQ